MMKSKFKDNNSKQHQSRSQLGVFLASRPHGTMLVLSKTRRFKKLNEIKKHWYLLKGDQDERILLLLCLI